MAQTKYLDYTGLQRLVENIDKKYAPISAIVFKSTVEDIASLPALDSVKAGFMYNLKVGGITTDAFVEGAGHILADGENIAAVELYTGNYTEKLTILPTDDPKALGWYEIDTTTDVYTPVEPVGTENPVTEGWYESDNLIPPTYTLSADTTVDAGKTYYAKTEEYTFIMSQDRLPVSGKRYFTADTVMKWDSLGGLFDLESRYLEFGDTFPRDSRVVDGRTFLFMGNSSKVYIKVASPEGRPIENGYFELNTATEIADASSIFNPKQQGFYEKDDTDPAAEFYFLSADTEYDDTKTYYECIFEESADSTVDTSKVYYTEADHYKKAVIYQYSEAEEDWIAQSNNANDDLIPITNKEIDDLFI